MPAVDVEHICEAIFENTSDRIVIGQVVVLLKVSVFIKIYCSVVSGEDMEVDGFAVVLGSRRDVIFQAFQ